MSRKRTVLSLALAAVLSGAVSAADRITPPPVPADIDVGTGYKPILRGHAIGTQNYICAPAATATGVDWLFLGPQATVFDDEGEQIVTHFLSKNPFRNEELHATWQHSRDSSVVWAKKVTGSTDSDYVAAGAIEWLKLEMTGAQVGSAGGAKLSGTMLIQRVNTVGGVKPPASECTPATLNARRLVAYEADYYFYQ